MQETTPAPVLKQVTLTMVQKSQESRSKFVTGFVKMCLVSNIPLEKVAIGKMTPWIKKINPRGGALSSVDNLRTYYIPKVAKEVHGAVSVFQVYNIIKNFQAVLEAKKTLVQFPEEIEAILSEANLSNRSLGDCPSTYQSAFKIATEKLNKHVEIQKPALNFFKSARVFDIRQKASLSRNIVDYLNTPRFSSNIGFRNEWVIYLNAVSPLENFEIDKFWEGKKNELPLMWKASRRLCTSAYAADVERSFSILILLDSPKRANLSEKALKNLLYCYFNSDFIKIEGSFHLNLQFTHVLPKEQK